MKHNILLLMFTIIFANLNIYSQQVEENIGLEEHLDQFIPDNITLINQDSVEVELKSLIDKPTIISFVYYNCPGLCSPLLGGIADAIERNDLVLGKDYQIITISFNPEDGPALGIAKKANFMNLIERKDVKAENWMWFTADSLNIDKITRFVGFRYKKEGKDYAHAAAIAVLSPDAKLTRYLYGTSFLPFDLKMALIEGQKGISSPTIHKVLDFCFSYDPQGKKYVFNITKITGSIMILLALSYFLVLIFKSKKPKLTQQKEN